MKDELPKFRVRRRGASIPADAAAPASAEAVRPRAASAGHVQFDDRGNAVWELAQQDARMDRGSGSQPMKILDNPTLSLAEDAPTPSDVVRPNPLGVVKGYNPYDSGKLDQKRRGPVVKKDLRKLSEWIKLRNQAAGNDPLEE